MQTGKCAKDSVKNNFPKSQITRQAVRAEIFGYAQDERKFFLQHQSVSYFFCHILTCSVPCQFAGLVDVDRTN